MQKKIEHIWESITEWYSDIIEQSINILLSDDWSNDYEEEVKNKILTCLTNQSECDITLNLSISRLKYILSNDLLLNKLDNDYKAELYALLAEKYILISNIELAKENFLESFNLGNTKVFEKYIYLEILIKKPLINLNNNSNNVGNFLFLEILDLIDVNKIDWDFLSALKADIEKFILWNISEIKDPLSIYDYIYNFEIIEEKLVYDKEVYSNLLIQWLTNSESITDDLNNTLNIMPEELYKSYQNLCENYKIVANAFTWMWKKLVKQSYSNMESRFKWNSVDFIVYWSYIKNMFEFFMEIIDININNSKYDEILDIYKFLYKNISQSWDNRLYTTLLSNIYKNKESLIKWLNNDDLKNFIYTLSEYNWLSIIDTIKMSDILLLLWDYLSAYNWYKYNISDKNLFNKKVIDLLEDMLFKKTFVEYSDSDFDKVQYSSTTKRYWFLEKTKMDSVQKISIILEKLNRGKILNIQDEQDIMDMCA